MESILKNHSPGTTGLPIDGGNRRDTWLLSGCSAFLGRFSRFICFRLNGSRRRCRSRGSFQSRSLLLPLIGQPVGLILMLHVHPVVDGLVIGNRCLRGLVSPTTIRGRLGYVVRIIAFLELLKWLVDASVKCEQLYSGNAFKGEPA